MSEYSGMPYIFREQCRKWAEVKEALREAYKLYPNEPDINCGEEIHLTIIKDENGRSIDEDQQPGSGVHA